MRVAAHYSRARPTMPRFHCTLRNTVGLLSPISENSTAARGSARRLTKQGEGCERSGWMDGVRGLEAISGQKLGGFRALWLPLFAPLIECHGSEVDERWIVLVGLRHSSHSMIEKPAPRLTAVQPQMMDGFCRVVFIYLCPTSGPYQKRCCCTLWAMLHFFDKPSVFLSIFEKGMRRVPRFQLC